MLKRMTVLFLCALLAAGAALAGAAEPDAPHEAPEAGSPLTLEGDLGLVVDGVWYPILNDAAPLIGALGEPLEVISAPSCVFRGEDREFVYDGMSVFTNPLGDMDVWYEAYISGEGFSTARGVAIGTPLDELIALYGDAFYMEGEDVLTYSLSGVEGDYESPCVMFELLDGRVSAIDLYYPTNTL